MKIQIFKFFPEDGLPYPKYSSEGAAGLDLYASSAGMVRPKSGLSVSTGIGLVIPEGWVGLLTGRSGLAFRYGVEGRLGIIDSDYRGEVKALLWNMSVLEYTFEKGAKIAQIIFVPCYHGAIEYISKDQADETLRGEKGFGSTGN